MSERNDEVTRVLAAIAEPEPPHALRTRTLGKAAETWGRPPLADRWHAAWASRPLRIAWAAAVIVLVTGNIVVRLSTGTSPRNVASRAARPTPATDRDLQAIASLPQLSPVYLGDGAISGSQRTGKIPEVARTQHSSEGKS